MPQWPDYRSWLRRVSGEEHDFQKRVAEFLALEKAKECTTCGHQHAGKCDYPVVRDGRFQLCGCGGAAA